MWRVVLRHLVSRLDLSTQELGGVAKRGAHIHLSLRGLLRLQGRRLPKRLVIRVSGKGEHVLDGTLDHHGVLLAYGHRAFSPFLRDYYPHTPPCCHLTKPDTSAGELFTQVFHGPCRATPKP